jgi:hypothetical protein
MGKSNKDIGVTVTQKSLILIFFLSNNSGNFTSKGYFEGKNVTSHKGGGVRRNDLVSVLICHLEGGRSKSA